MGIKIYHNSRCSKSRQTLEILKKKNSDIEIVEYLKSPPTFEELSVILGKLKYEPRELLRKSEEVYKKENLSDMSISNNKIIEKMVTYPILIERPIVINGDKAVIGRPPERVLDII
jgi:arsenate reductase|tara:strand:- start:181 stop:528 length:348 start_codon:yes stop_codon:yes gene_type:complete